MGIWLGIKRVLVGESMKKVFRFPLERSEEKMDGYCLTRFFIGIITFNVLFVALFFMACICVKQVYA